MYVCDSERTQQETSFFFVMKWRWNRGALASTWLNVYLSFAFDLFLRVMFFLLTEKRKATTKLAQQCAVVKAQANIYIPSPYTYTMSRHTI